MCTVCRKAQIAAIIPWKHRNGKCFFGKESPRPKPGTESFVRDMGQTVPVMTSVAVPGVTVNVPSVFCVNVAAGTVICPASVVKTPVAVL